MLLLMTSFAGAQRFDGYFGIGTTRVGAVQGTYVDDNTGETVKSPDMGGVFGTIGGAVMINPHFGVGLQISFRFDQGDYLGFGYRPIFYDFNGIWTPQIHSIEKTVVPEFQGGFGGLNLRFYDPSNYYYDYNSGRYTNFAGSSNHLQLHAAAGMRFKIKPTIWVRPMVEYRWVRNLEEFGSNNVLSYSLAIGFSSSEF
jgi:hypothetical protein